MSSVKRSNLTASEHGQSKAPDKWEPPSKTSANALAANPSDTCETMSSTSAKSQTQQQSRDAQKSVNSTQEVTKNFDLDESELKNLLDEAYSYKGPKDKENKSEIFKELLHKAELEDQQRDSFFSSSQYRGNSRRHHTGGSLQDLVDSVNNEQLLDCDYMLGSQTRRHQQHSRYTKNSSSVSSRQREGGSLPNNVNSSSCYPISAFSLSKYPKTNTKNSGRIKADSHDYERTLTNHHRNTFIGDSVSYCEEPQSSVASTSTAVSCANEKNHTIINIDDPEEASHLLAHDSLAQDTSEANRDDGTELVSIKKHRLPTMSFLPTNVKEIGETSRQHCSVDQPIKFIRYPTASEPTQLSSKEFTKSLVDTKHTTNRHVQLSQIQVNPSKFDENGNAILPKPATNALAPSQTKGKTKRNKAERNTKTWTVQGSETPYNIDLVLAFIENTDTTKKTNIINVNKNNLSVAERNRKEKKSSGNNKKEVSRLKKSTSMEELKSSSKIEEEIAQSERAQVSLRQKQLQQQQNAQKRNSTTDSKELNSKHSSNSQQQSNKRGERRSWGTEELNDFEAVEDRDIKKHKENKSNVKNMKKIELVASTNASIESIPTNVEAAEFHVVTKKKKTKKRQIIEEAKAKQQQMSSQRDQMHALNRNNNTAIGGHKYQPSSTYTNDRDIYVNAIMTKENRRKSTSSVPPSDKSDSSDLDSVHSLPVESTTTSTSLISYAEIARKANNQPEKLSNPNAWPTVSQNGKISETPDNSNTSTSSSTVSSKSHTSNRSNDTIKASSPCEEKPMANFDDSQVLDTPKSQPMLGEYVKNQLQKSKSCDSEKYTTAMSLDQFPGLEKTVKPQKSQPNFASVLTSPPPTNEKINKAPTTKKPTPSTETNTAKENAVKVQQLSDEKVDAKSNVDVNSSKFVFVQNSAKAEEIANSESSSNLFVSINSSTVKKAKKSQQNANSTSTSMSSKINSSQRTVRQTAVVFSDRETNHENVSPLLFGDFNDDILQLMKQEENHIDDEIPNELSSIHDASVSNCTSEFDSADFHVTNECNQTKSNTFTPMMSSQSDPGYASAHRINIPTESHGVVDMHKVHTENHIGTNNNNTISELSNKKGNVTKKSSLNKINVNNKTSDVVSNQSLNSNNNTVKNDLSINDTMVKSATIIHTTTTTTINDSDTLNNNISSIQINDKSKHDVNAKPQHNDAAINKSLNAANIVHSTVSKTTNPSAANYQPKGINAYDSVNSKNLNNFSNGPKVVPSSSSSNKRSSAENEVVPVNSQPANIPQKNASCAEIRASFTHHHNHNDIVHFVGSAWEEVKYGRFHRDV